MGSPHDVTALLGEWSRGNGTALNQLLPLVYAELRRVAARQLRNERADHTLQPTALVHEAYIRLVGQRQVDWDNRAHFFGVAAYLMRQILVQHARVHTAAKRGGGTLNLSLEDALTYSDENAAEMVQLESGIEAADAKLAEMKSVMEALAQ